MRAIDPLQPPPNPMLTCWINRRRSLQQADMLFSGDEIVYGPQTPLYYGNYALPYHWSILRAKDPLQPPPKHIHTCLLKGLYPINPPCHCRMQVLLWGARGVLPPAAAMVVFVFCRRACELGVGENKPPMPYAFPCMYGGLDCLIFRGIMDGGWSSFGMNKS